MTLTAILLMLASAPEPRCASGPITPDVVVTCARAVSPTLRADRQRIGVARGEQTTARVLLPSNPEVGFSAAHRENDLGDRGVNFYGAITQEVEIGGQRRKRIAAAAADRVVAEQQAVITERDVVATALLTYYDALAARREADVIEGTLVTAVRLEEVARARAAAGSGAPIEIDLAESETIALREEVALARGRSHAAEARLALLVGRNSATDLELVGGLDPLPVPIVDDLGLAKRRPELLGASARRRAGTARLGALQRSRAPNLRFSFIVQQDGFRERVLGGGIALPIPLPAPLGRTNKGEIQAARAEIREADARASAAERDVALDVAVARSEFAARREASAAYTSDALERARISLQDLADHAASGRLDVRDAMLTQRALLGLLLREVRARHALCRAAVELLRASGASFVRGDR